jgi:hypothetical protein
MVQIHSPRPTIYCTRIVVERLVAGQDVEDSNPFATTVLSALKSMRYAAFSIPTSTSFLRTTRTTSQVLFGNSKPSPNTRSFSKSVGTNRESGTECPTSENAQTGQVGLQSSANQSISWFGFPAVCLGVPPAVLNPVSTPPHRWEDEEQT